MSDITPTLVCVALSTIAIMATAAGIAAAYGLNALVGAALMAASVGFIVYAWCRA
jgi:hypothetical protein